eukprot:CAMPEP_0175089666 /NCGR_PEP_ID=MMETSP0086_2-20121207/907_1 /TAXON_ID=136419 /ORGANISM="Unknown Unknown, Strain D1" /LENGTH=611 /DNA_ID=CAMNT_0016362189 /DNA_START=61 /DNA_END=1893 /DNA_ORIENTATION=+
MADGEDNTYYLEEVSIDDDEDVEDDMEYEEVPLEDEEEEESEDDFTTVLQNLKKGEEGGVSNIKAARAAPAPEKPKVGVENKPTVVDDFIRNFLIKLKMTQTLDTFNTEWYELAENGKLNEEDVGVVSDIYQRNENLDDQVKRLREEVLKSRSIAEKARGTWDKFRKERDFHRMHHRRVVQEKNVLIKDMKRLKKHYGTFEPALKAMREKYENAMKDKMLMKLERDRMASRLETVEAQLRTLEGDDEKQTVPPVKGKKGASKAGAGKKKDPKAKTLEKGTRITSKTHSKDSLLPPDDRMNPYLERTYTALPVHSFSLRKTFKGHQMAISGIAIHPTKPIVATVSDDRTWKMWSIQRGELIMSGDGHKDWVASCDFHPGGSLLATASGDGTVKLWNFVKASCEFTFTDHTQAVWDCKFHDTGDFLVSASMDHSAKVWDVNSQRCRQSLRGHVDSINSLAFQPFSNNIATASGDKTVSLWDLRSGLCVQTFYGHENAVLSTSFNYQGDCIASADSDGVVKVWDVRTVGERLEINTSENGQPNPVNDVKFDASGQVLVAALETGNIKAYGIGNEEAVEELGYLDGHEGAVQAVVMDSNSGFLMSAGSDQTFRLW